MKFMADDADIDVTEAGGFDVNIVNQSVSKENLICTICLLVLREPMQAVPCGHRFCKSCIGLEKARQESEDLLCPNDREKISVFPDVGKQREIYSFQVACQNGGPSKCQWNGELREYKEHLEQCPFQLVECEKNCGRKDILRKDMPLHIEDECPKNLLSCAFAPIGCQFKGKPKELEKHQKDSAVQHLFMQAASHSERIASLEDDLSNERDKNAKLEKEVAQLKRKNVEDVTKLKEDIALNFERRRCPFTFKIRNVTAEIQKRYRFVIHSDTFEVLHGYRARLKVSFNNIFSKRFPGKKFVGVLFQVMQGPHDDVLEWPMRLDEILVKCYINGNIVRAMSKKKDCPNLLFPRPFSFDGGSSQGCSTFLDQAKDIPSNQDEIDILVDVKKFNGNA